MPLYRKSHDSGLEVMVSKSLFTLDVESFLVLRENICPEMSEPQIRRWYPHFVSPVCKYDDKINNHLKYSRNWWF